MSSVAITTVELPSQLDPEAATSSLLRYPVAYATGYSPCGQRRRWAAMVRCPYCAGGHLLFGGAREDLTGIKRAGCGRGRIWVVVALTVLTTEEVRDVA